MGPSLITTRHSGCLEKHTSLHGNSRDTITARNLGFHPRKDGWTACVTALTAFPSASSQTSKPLTLSILPAPQSRQFYACKDEGPYDYKVTLPAFVALLRILWVSKAWSNSASCTCANQSICGRSGSTGRALHARSTVCECGSSR